MRAATLAIACLALGLAAALATGAPEARVHQVQTPKELRKAIARAGPGDEIVIRDGVYQAWTLGGGFQRLDGAPGAPIRIRPQTPGGVIFGDGTQLRLWGRDIEISGFWFRGNGILYLRGAHLHVHDNAFLRWGLKRGAGVVIDPGSGGARFENNFMAGRIGKGQALTLDKWEKRDTFREPSPMVARHNVFGWRHPFCPGGNGCEALVLSPNQELNPGLLMRIERNLFERAGAEAELISDKAGNTLLRGNTVRSATGCVVARHSPSAVYEDNVILDSCGFRIGSGSDEGVNSPGVTLRNNYVETRPGHLRPYALHIAKRERGIVVDRNSFLFAPPSEELAPARTAEGADARSQAHERERAKHAQKPAVVIGGDNQALRLDRNWIWNQGSGPAIVSKSPPRTLSGQGNRVWPPARGDAAERFADALAGSLRYEAPRVGRDAHGLRVWQGEPPESAPGARIVAPPLDTRSPELGPSWLPESIRQNRHLAVELRFDDGRPGWSTGYEQWRVDLGASAGGLGAPGSGVSGAPGDRALRTRPGADDARGTVIADRLSDGLHTFTLQGWLRRTGAAPGGVIFSQTNAGGGFALALTPAGALALSVAGTEVARSEPGFGARDEWQFFAVAFEGARGAAHPGRVRFHRGGLDSAARAVGEAATSLSSTPAGAPATLRFGAGFDGFLDALRFYPAALEVGLAAERGREPPPIDAALVRLDEAALERLRIADLRAIDN